MSLIVLQEAQVYRLRVGERLTVSPVLSLDPLTAGVTLSIQRPTTAEEATAWAETTRIQSLVHVAVDAEEYRCGGSVSGGVRQDMTGAVMGLYRLRYGVPVLFGEAARAYIRDNPARDAEGFYTNVPLTRIGETGQAMSCQVQLQHLAGEACTLTVGPIVAEVLPAPRIRHRNSIAFDAATDAQEASGDGVLSLTHTASGSNLCAFVGCGNSDLSPSDTSATTYDGVAMTEKWDTGNGQYVKHSGHVLAGIPTGAKTVTHTLAGATSEHIMSVITCTGVHQTTPSGTPQTANSSSGGTSHSVTVTGVNATDMLVDFSYVVHVEQPTFVVGANQTARTNEFLPPYAEAGTSTQSGADGGVMSWSFNGSNYGSGMGALALIEAVAAGASLVSRRQVLGGIRGR